MRQRRTPVRLLRAWPCAQPYCVQDPEVGCCRASPSKRLIRRLDLVLAVFDVGLHETECFRRFGYSVPMLQPFGTHLGAVGPELTRPASLRHQLWAECRGPKNDSATALSKAIARGAHRDRDAGVAGLLAEGRRPVLDPWSEWWTRPGSGRRRASAICVRRQPGRRACARLSRRRSCRA